jgi:hypothetical protein
LATKVVPEAIPLGSLSALGALFFLLAAADPASAMGGHGQPHAQAQGDVEQVAREGGWLDIEPGCFWWNTQPR